MERLVEVSLDYSDNQDKILNFKIYYPEKPEEVNLSDNLKKLQQTIDDLQEKLTESEDRNAQKDKDLSEILFKLQDQAAKFSEQNKVKDTKLKGICEQLEASDKKVEAISNDLKIANSKIEELENLLNAKSNMCAKLSKTLKEREKNRSTAEVLLEKQEEMNKDLIEKNVKIDKVLKDSEKKNEEKAKIIKKLKEEITSNNELVNLRDEQIKSVIKKIKSQESEVNKLQEDIKRRDEIIKGLHSNIKDTTPPIEIKPSLVHQKEYKKAMELVNAKESEIKMMKEMLKSYQLKQHRSPAMNSFSKNTKLPPITSQEKQIKSVEKQIKFKEPSKSSLREQDLHPYQKVRKDTPPAKKTFKGVAIFADKESPERREDEGSDLDRATEIQNAGFYNQDVNDSDRSWNKSPNDVFSENYPSSRSNKIISEQRIVSEKHNKEAAKESFKIKPAKQRKAHEEKRRQDSVEEFMRFEEQVRSDRPTNKSPGFTELAEKMRSPGDKRQIIDKETERIQNFQHKNQPSVEVFEVIPNPGTKYQISAEETEKNQTSEEEKQPPIKASEKFQTPEEKYQRFHNSPKVDSPILEVKKASERSNESLRTIPKSQNKHEEVEDIENLAELASDNQSVTNEKPLALKTDLLPEDLESNNKIAEEKRVEIPDRVLDEKQSEDNFENSDNNDSELFS